MLVSGNACILGRKTAGNRLLSQTDGAQPGTTTRREVSGRPAGGRCRSPSTGRWCR